MVQADKLQAITDVIVGDPFMKSVVTDIDGNKKFIYTPNAWGVGSIPCAEAALGKVWYLFNFLATALISLVMWEPNTVYRKYQIVRYGLDDYLSLAETSTIPTTPGIWVKIRENIQGPQGESGENTSITT